MLKFDFPGSNFLSNFLKFDFLKTTSTPEHRKAWFIAMLADAIQIVGYASVRSKGAPRLGYRAGCCRRRAPYRILGWHWAFLPTFAAELVPGLDLFPTWTAAVFFVTRSATRSTEPEILEPGPAPARRP